MVVVVVCGISFLEEETNLEATKDPHTLIAFWGELKKKIVCAYKQKSFRISHFSKLFTTNIFQLFLVVKLALVFTNVDSMYFSYRSQFLVQWTNKCSYPLQDIQTPNQTFLVKLTCVFCIFDLFGEKVHQTKIVKKFTIWLCKEKKL